MSGIPKAALLLAAALTAVMIAPVLIVASLLPTHTSRSFYSACSELRGNRAGILPDPPSSPPTADEVLLRIDQTASTLGFGRQGATVAAAISWRRTGLANAANPAVPDTERYAHSAVIHSGAGALGLPETWGTPAELMTPAVSTALLMDHMANRIPNWRDLPPDEIAATLLGGPAEDYSTAAATARALLESLPAPQYDRPTSRFTPAAATHPHRDVEGLDTAARPSLNPERISAATRDNPTAAACVQALALAAPPPAPGPNPRGPALAAAAYAALGTEPPRKSATRFVVDLYAAQGVRLPDSLADLFTIGWAAASPEPGDLVFTDISADQGPHLVGVAVTRDAMITVLPGRATVEDTPIGPNRIIRRIEVSAA